MIPCAVCGRDSKGGFCGNIPLCFNCYINRPDDVLAYEAKAKPASGVIEVVNKKNYQGDGIYIGRPSLLGNPFTHRPGTTAQTVVGSREEAVERYREWLREQWKAGGPTKAELIRLARLYKETGRLTLICWCAPERCHGHVLQEVIPLVANRL